MLKTKLLKGIGSHQPPISPMIWLKKYVCNMNLSRDIKQVVYYIFDGNALILSYFFTAKSDTLL